MYIHRKLSLQDTHMHPKMGDNNSRTINAAAGTSQETTQILTIQCYTVGVIITKEEVLCCILHVIAPVLKHYRKKSEKQ